MSLLIRIVKTPVDIVITTVFWSYFLLGYLVFYIPALLIVLPFTSDKGFLFQKVNHIFYKIFFKLVRTITPGLIIDIGKDIPQIKSAVVIANHRSYLDPILLISLFPRHKTIVKGVFFKIPIMRWIMKSGGYIPFSISGESKELMIEGIQTISDFFRKGGVLFIFPEGRRSRDGKLGNFQKGAFSIADKCKVPIQVLYINNSDRLFTPGKFLFNTCIENRISIELLGCIDPEDSSNLTVRALRDTALDLYHRKMKVDTSC